MIRAYLTERGKPGRPYFVLIDSRAKPTEIDLEFIQWCARATATGSAALTKARQAIPISEPRPMSISFSIEMERLICGSTEFFVTSCVHLRGQERVDPRLFEENVTEYYEAG